MFCENCPKNRRHPCYSKFTNLRVKWPVHGLPGDGSDSSTSSTRVETSLFLKILELSRKRTASSKFRRKVTSTFDHSYIFEEDFRSVFGVNAESFCNEIFYLVKEERGKWTFRLACARQVRTRPRSLIDQARDGHSAPCGLCRGGM